MVQEVVSATYADVLLLVIAVPLLSGEFIKRLIRSRSFSSIYYIARTGIKHHLFGGTSSQY